MTPRPAALSVLSAFSVLCVFSALPVLSAQTPAPPPPVKLSGYLQARETYQEDVGLTASINRARLAASGSVTPAVSWRIQGEFRTGAVGTGRASVSLQDAFIRLARAQWAVQLGQFKTPFTREFLTSLADVETADRAAVVDALAPKRDIGVQGEYTIAKGATLTVGAFNGEGQNVTANADSTVLGIGRVVVSPFPKVSIGAGAARYFSDSTRYSADVNYEDARFRLRAEYVGQSHDGVSGGDDKGWYTLGAYAPTPVVQILGKYEWFDRPATGPAQKNRAWTVGVNLFPYGRATRVTLEYISRKVGRPGSRTGTLLGQAQVRF